MKHAQMVPNEDLLVAIEGLKKRHHDLPVKLAVRSYVVSRDKTCEVNPSIVVHIISVEDSKPPRLTFNPATRYC
jgi:hypothetical protein